MKTMVARNVYASLCAAICAASFLYVILALGAWHGSFWYLAVLFGASVLFGFAAISIFRRWRQSSWFSGFAAALLILYAFTVLLLGWEDLGGGSVAILLVLGFGLAGTLGAVVASQAQSPNNSLKSDAAKPRTLG